MRARCADLQSSLDDDDDDDDDGADALAAERDVLLGLVFRPQRHILRMGVDSLAVLVRYAAGLVVLQ